MDQPRWIPQLYGYSVCFITLVTVLFSLSSIVGNSFEYSAPEMSREVTMEYGGRSAEACRQRFNARTPNRGAQVGAGSAVAPVLPADSVLLKLCAEERAERIATVRHTALRGLVSSTLMMLLAIVLFIIHWRWVRGSRTTMA